MHRKLAPETTEKWTFLRHIPCPDCGSRDNAAEYAEGHRWCFGCGSYARLGGVGVADPGVTPSLRRKRGARMGGQMISGEIRGLRARNITDATCQHFGYQCGTYKKKDVQIAPYYDADGQVVAQKIRGKDKTFSWLGDPEKALPFGAQAWPKTGKMIVVTEGEIDALSMSQVQGNKWPVVSIASGAGAQTKRYIAKHRDYFLGFEKIVLMFDMDEPGRAAAKEAAQVLGSRAHIAELPLKDANEMLLAGRTEEMLTAMWRAQPYRPEGIVELSSLRARIKAPVEQGRSWWSPALTALTYGKRDGEVYALGAGTGVGKTDFMTQDMMHTVAVQGRPIGVFSLEQGVVETAKRIAGKVAKRTFHIPDGSWTEAELDAALDVLAKHKIFLYDSYGCNEWETIKEKIEYLYHAEGVRDFYLDHLTALVAEEEDERKALEQLMSSMSKLAKALGIIIIFVSHLATPEKGPSHEEGGRVTIRHFKGSRAIGYWAHYMFGLERNQQAEDEEERTTTVFRVLKDRYTGRATGKTFYLAYDSATGLLYETTPPEERKAEMHGFKDESLAAAPAEASSDF